MEDWSVPALKVSPLIFHLDSHCTHSSTVQILDLSVRQHCLCCPAVAQALFDLADVLSRAMFVYSTGCVLADLASVSRDFLIC